MQVELPSAVCLFLKQEGLSLTHKTRYQGPELSDDATASEFLIREDEGFPVSYYYPFPFSVLVWLYKTTSLPFIGKYWGFP